MRNLLRISIVSNIVLAGAIVFLVLRDQAVGPVGQQLSDRGQDSGPEAQAAPSRPKESIHATLSTFNWSQIESDDYRTYIGNLRAIGCPEQTIRDLITADVESLYAHRREELKRKRTSDVSLMNGSNPQQAFDACLRQLQNEQSQVIMALLGAPPTSVSQTASVNPPSTTAWTNRTRSQAELDLARPLVMPLVLQAVDSAVMPINEQQLRVINQLRQEFQQETTEHGLNPNDPAYRQLWQASQRKADDRLAALLGRNFSYVYQMRAQNQPQNQPLPGL